MSLFKIKLKTTSPNIKRFFFAAVVWLAIVVGFATIYWSMWQARPDAFIVNKEFNFNPFETLRLRLEGNENSKMWPGSATVPPPTATELDTLMATVAEMDKTASDLEVGVASLRVSQEALEKESKAAIKLHSDALAVNMEKYKQEQLAQVNEEVRRKEASLETVEKYFGSTPSSYQGIVLAELRVTLAEARLREATKTSEVYEYIVNNFGKFSDKEASERTGRLEDEIKSNNIKQGEIIRKLGDLRKRAFESLSNWGKARRSRLLWIDFAYFSVGVSTSTTFGDIIPNSRPARMAALVQLVSSVFLLGYLLSFVSSSQPIRDEKH